MLYGECLTDNPACQTWQGDTTSANPAAQTMFGDRWKISRTGAGATINMSRGSHLAAEPLSRLSPYFIRMTVATLGSLTNCSIDTTIPDLLRLSNRTVTFVAAVRSNAVKTIALRTTYNAGTGGTGAPAAVDQLSVALSANVWTYLRKTVLLADCSAAVLGAGNHLAVNLRYDSPGANIYDVGGMWAQFGNKIFTLQPMRDADVLAVCQRYYWRGTVRAPNGTRWIAFPVTMRTIPAVTLSAGTASNISADGFELTHTTATNITVTADANP